eukprot:TRINITY_DN38730_c0_g1_i1.p1 TRINITY_DN38730_c0_g1~~TRINITY_DN38730_c0_g1_i1.p1  ORF type:complete len:181 (+),score=25.24 TRINITY_DN38730_c0_g1_i1:43-543(+)
MERYIERVKKAIVAKEPPLKVAETRLSKRTKRPEVEACNDTPHSKLLEEVSELKESIRQLETKLKESEESLNDLNGVKAKLEEDIKVKKNSLLIDQQKCMSMRRTLPYNIVVTRWFETGIRPKGRCCIPCGLPCGPPSELRYDRDMGPVHRVMHQPKPSIYKVWNT